MTTARGPTWMSAIFLTAALVICAATESSAAQRMVGSSLRRPLDTAAGTILQATVTATYGDRSSMVYSTQSNGVEVIVQGVSALAVGPNETQVNAATDASVAGQPVTKTFTVYNAGNQPASVTVTSASLTAGSLQGVTFVNGSSTMPATIGSTASPLIPVGGSMSVLVTVNSNGIAAGSPFSITLTVSTTSGTTTITNSATQFVVLAPQAQISGSVSTPGSTPQLLAQGGGFIQVSPGGTVPFSVTYANTGGVSASNVVLTTTAPQYLSFVASSVSAQSVGNAPTSSTLTKTVSYAIPTLAPGQQVTVTYQGVVDTTAPLGVTIATNAIITSSNAATVTSTTAAIFVGSGNLVFAVGSASNSPVTPAIVQFVTPQTGLPIALGTTGFTPNTGNANPYTTGTAGMYAFELSPAQIGSAAAPGTYQIFVTATGYTNRIIGVTLTPGTMNGLYNATIKSLDGQPLAVAGGFTLTTQPVSLTNVNGFFGNIPMFTVHAISVTNVVDKSAATAGDRLFYTATISSATTLPLGSTIATATLAPGTVYGRGSARVNGVPVEPTVNGRILTWTIPSLSTQVTITYAAVILVGTPDGSTLTNIFSAATNAVGSNAVYTASADAETLVMGGILSDHDVITGRVFVDKMGTGHFTRGDAGVENVRIFMEDGSSVLTDRNGRFSFPATRPGMHVLRLDATTLPDGVSTFAERRYDNERSPIRLVHGVFDNAYLADVNFALRVAP